jgi:hypothetical protein
LRFVDKFFKTLITLATLCYSICPAAFAAHRMPNSIDLEYNEKLAAIGFSNPLLRGTIRGQTVWFIVDTGASVHTLASWLVKAAHIPTRNTGATATGSTGSDSPLRVAHNQKIRLEHGKSVVRLREAIVVDLPPIFEQQRLGGLLSPQLLAASGTAAILDLRAPQLSFRSFDEAVREFAIQKRDSATSRVCSNQGSRFTNRLYAAPISIEGTNGLMLIDTGATSSLLQPESPLSKQLSGRASASGNAQGVGGEAKKMRKVPNVAIELGGAKAIVPISIGGSAPSCGTDGLLGIDALRRCVLVLGQSSFAFTCHEFPTQ